MSKPLPAGSITRLSEKDDPEQKSLVKVIDRCHIAAHGANSKLPCGFKAVKGTCTGQCRRCRPAFGEPAKADTALLKLCKAACSQQLLDFIGADTPLGKL